MTPTTDKEMILSPNSWPSWPILPMKRSGNQSPSCGLIVGDPNNGKVYFVPGANIWHIDDEFIKNNGSFVQVDALLAQGWTVD
jgi:hypothetical protein